MKNDEPRGEYERILIQCSSKDYLYPQGSRLKNNAIKIASPKKNY